MTEQAIDGILQKRAAEAGVDDLSPHDLRRTFVGDSSTGARTSPPCSGSPGTPT